MSDHETNETSDPLIDEIRRIRADISRQFDDDIGKLCDHLKEVQKSMPNRLVRELPPRTDSKSRTAG